MHLAESCRWQCISLAGHTGRSRQRLSGRYVDGEKGAFLNLRQLLLSALRAPLHLGAHAQQPHHSEESHSSRPHGALHHCMVDDGGAARPTHSPEGGANAFRATANDLGYINALNTPPP